MCKCYDNYLGSPPNCRPECITNNECSLNQACVNKKCIDPCTNACGEPAECTVHRHAPYCTCKSGFEGDPFVRCIRKEITTSVINPCLPNPCGPFSVCDTINDRHVCSCKEGYLGAPPNCRRECAIHQDCTSDKACIREKCLDPCIGSCGFNADCRAIDHLAICTCRKGYKGNPFENCYLPQGNYNIIVL